MNSEAKYLELKEQLYELCGIKPSHLLLAEVAYCQIRTLLTDETRINPVTATELYAYEIPENHKEDLLVEDSGNDTGLLQLFFATAIIFFNKTIFL